ncbi:MULTISPECIES: ATP phosphoribosyltransferase [Cyanophyceae]|uniref:ATP phosphoribosyltransferase n=1 Tax=Picosynechococcus sp. (strain ATCC 27264 / PCC 7002 / PR-6) TaxID=32049 RepID=HIS1_PICP2|nr:MULTISPECIES: ATP phosphoribosyltransferase [Cyanophyceae]B1XPZ8.1 RecName: Full=ATP phosphoribosyltransferase; Short=ATP-PRT; Short=ATP-PRTase [Picosynechococcus sp. PCC 7002]ACA98626.1 ATP phosphoribosyltransferase [Picosynechococcus sp. PCC 7002]AMA08411.1 ATP phosphoribosyltransferase [Picosynechococcus sp. PCC 73109]ANV86556.1 ATP phosphoribosyltransferase [Picosynechococcus sp. PCC 7117]ANV89721.1 ATP phosphoribosyltransferase [Picosynechococcus sp. PCC 8807]QCS49236.1 ATP phosphorib
MLTIAIPKGGLLPEAIALLQQVGLDFSAFLDKKNRQLQITDPTGTARAMLVRTHDVPVYVEYGQAQLGFAGYDVLREKKPDVANLLDLGFGGCRLSVAVPKASPYKNPRQLPPNCRVASKFVNCAKDYFRDLDLPIEVIPLHGSVELGPITGMSEAIVDLVSTGNTLRENNLEEVEVLFHSTVRLIAHPTSYRANRHNMLDWVQKLEQIL